MRVWMGVALLAAGAVMAACSTPGASPTSPSASAGSGAAAADGSTLKVAGPRLVAPTNGANVTATPLLVVEPIAARFTPFVVTTARFQVSQSNTFNGLSDEGTATAPANNLITYRVQRAQAAGTRIYWRARAEFDGAFGPWSATGEFVVPATTPAPTPGTNRTPNPPPGQQLPLPNMAAQIAQWTAERPDLFPAQQCPLGVKYVNNPWQDYIMDRLRQIDTRWGYNAKPLQTPANNGGRPVVAAGDEILYNWGPNPDEGNTAQVYAVDILIAHCGDKSVPPVAPTLTWRVFTGEEPVRWTGAGRF